LNARPQLVELLCVAEIAKNSGQVVRVTLDQINGQPLLGIRVWERHRNGEKRPTQAGIACRAELIPKIAAAVGRAFEEAQSRGMLS
jgi:hypothetical protein